LAERCDQSLSAKSAVSPNVTEKKKFRFRWRKKLNKVTKLIELPLAIKVQCWKKLLQTFFISLRTENYVFALCAMMAKKSLKN
jgi:hypothetical protein